MNLDQLNLLKSGDNALFSNLVREHHRALIALAVPLVGSSDAEEVVQNAWVKAYKAIGSFEGKSHIRTWLSRIVINESKMQLRRGKKETFFADIVLPEAGNALEDQIDQHGEWLHPPINWHYDSPDALLMQLDLENCLERLLKAMPDNQRAILEMRDTNELPFDEICNTLGVSASNTRVLLHRARTQLFKLVNHYQETGEC